MKVGIITNLVNSDDFLKNHYEAAGAEEILKSTGGNTGNVAFVHAVQKIIGGKQGVVHWGDDPEKVNSYYDKLVICCANQLGVHTDLKIWAQKLLQFNLPVMIVGIGAQADKIGDIPELPEGTLKFLDAVNTLRSNPEVSNIITRGNFTSLVLKNYGYESLPFGCPSLLTSNNVKLGFKCLGRQDTGSYSRIAIAGGNPWHHQSSFLEKKLTSMVEMFNGEYILQHPLVMFQLANDSYHDMSENQKNHIQKIYSNLGSIKEISNWFQSYGTYFVDAPNWMRFYNKFNQIIGPRYHGVALGIQAGIPGKVIAIDSRTEELSMTTGVPYLNIDDVKMASEEEIKRMSEWTVDDAIKLDDKRKTSASNYFEILGSNNIPISEHLSKLNKMFGEDFSK